MKNSLPLLLLSVCLAVLFLRTSFAQSLADEKPTIAVLPFQFSSAVNVADANALSLKVESAFINSKRFTVIERANFAQIFQELEDQKSEIYISSDRLAQQGKLIGASQIVVGNIASYDNTNGTTFSIKVVDISTGETIGSKEISNRKARETTALGTSLIKSVTQKGNNGKSLVNESQTSSIAGQIALNIEKEVSDFINEFYSLKFDILEISKLSKGTASEILIVAGQSSGIKKGTRLDVIQESEMQYNGKTIRRKSVVAKAYVLNIEGDVTTCKVSEGGKELSDLLSNSSNRIYTSTVTK